MTTVLVVDDSPLDRRLAAALVEEFGATVELASHGLEALAMIDKQAPDLVLTDLQMPELDGLHLVGRLRQTHPTLPVILMTAFGSEEIAVKALQSGAASYVPKSKLPAELARTIENVLAVVRQPVVVDPIETMTYWETRFEMGAQPKDSDRLVAYFQDQLRRLELCDDADLIRVGTALHEALVNAIEHGNLELSSDLREKADNTYRQLAKQRAEESPYSDRKVYVAARFHRHEAHFEIRDEGPGFDVTTLPDPTDPENLGKVSGRGLFLIRTFMDDVTFNDDGNQITMIKRCRAQDK